MCTAVSYTPGPHYFGRNLDLERGYGECVAVTARNFPFTFRHTASLYRHHALIGTAAVANGYPLYFEATNEKGLSMAGLNFPGNAVYGPYAQGSKNVAPFELIPWLLGQCTDLQETKQLLRHVHILDESFSDQFPVSPLHWLIADKTGSVTLECTADGMTVWDNPYGVLTNNPPFDFHLQNLHHYMALHEGGADNRLCPRAPLSNISFGLGAFGLPGDFSSSSRFVKAVFVKEKSLPGETEGENVRQFFRILQSVAMPKGCVKLPSGEFEYTRYSCCCSDTGDYYFSTYDEPNIRRISLSDSDLECDGLQTFPM